MGLPPVLVVLRVVLFAVLTGGVRLVITSEAFDKKMQSARHRMVYALLRDEMSAEGGIHALQLRTMTPDEEVQRKKKEEDAAAAKAKAQEAESDDKSET